MEKHGLYLLSLFPVQVMGTLGEWLTVPHMNRILLGNLPLVLIRMLKLADLSAANGQFMLFQADEYRRYWFHERVKKEKVEDIRIMRMMKKLGLKTQTLLSGGQISCRMYRGLGDGISGFSKNIHAFFGRNWLVLIIYVLLTVLGPFAAYFSFHWVMSLTYLAGLVLFVGVSSFQSRQPVHNNILLLPLQMITLLVIAIMAAYRQITGRLYWKGRKI
jgi:chlorobactene glucosyltransferase